MEVQDSDDTIDAVQLTAWLKQQVAEKVGLHSKEIDEHIPLTRYGLDSSAMLTLACDLEDYIKIEFEHERLYEHPTIAAIVNDLIGLGATGQSP